MIPLTLTQEDHIKAAVVQRYLEHHDSFNDFIEATKSLSTDRFEKHFLVQEDRAFLNTFLLIEAAFSWEEAEENGWGTTAGWSTLRDNWNSFYELESQKIDLFLDSIICFDLQRFFEEQGIGIDLFIAEIVRQKSIDSLDEDVRSHAIWYSFEWVEAIELGISWYDINDEWLIFYQSKSEVAAL